MRHQNERDLPVKLVLVNLSHNPSEMTYLYDDDHHHIRVGMFVCNAGKQLNGLAVDI